MLTLAVETSQARYALALGRDGAVLFDTLRDLGPDTGRDLGDLLALGLAHVGARAADIGAVAVDIGPGSLGSLRDGVAFTHGLAYARSLPVYAFTSFELIGAAAGATALRPALCTRRANEGLAYAGLYDGGRVVVMRHGERARVVADVAGAGTAFVAAGSFRAETAAQLAHADVADSGVETPAAATMLTLGLAGRMPGDVLRSPVYPLHEGAAVFRE
ncbi:MAG: tRNA (adenosine(37)-N6)-threonylcarbamoyltransferase complex dimerization subunit type 1 TsaB [Hyphomonadaceae bacterium]|nr:tRNA (adenosine(37)-N6)-threonylcarbamoyltransferase complex dimerization subunit type 1 TsaB [Hyphomonadaceae bacterium]